jgi:hypothetical protein
MGVVVDWKPLQQVTKQLRVYAAWKYNSCPRERERLIRNKNRIFIKYYVTTKTPTRIRDTIKISIFTCSNMMKKRKKKGDKSRKRTN